MQPPSSAKALGGNGSGEGWGGVAGSGDDDDDLFTEEMHCRADILAARDFLDSTDDVFRRGRGAGEQEAPPEPELEGGGQHPPAEEDESRGGGGETEPLTKKKKQEQDFGGGEGIEWEKSHSYRRGESEAVWRTLAEVERVAKKRVADGFHETNFTVGVVNLIVVTFVFGVYPQHFWIVYLIEGTFLMAVKFAQFVRARPLNCSLYFLDFCWVMNVFGVVTLMVFLIDDVVGRPVSDSAHRHIFNAALGVACGPLLGACLVLPFVCLLFHDVGTMADLFIHIFPPLVVYTLRWSADEVREAWPDVFYLDYLEDVRFYPALRLGTVAGNSAALYLTWFVAYSVWMVLIGLNLPRSDRTGTDGESIMPRYDTVFHSLMRGGLCSLIGAKLWSRPESESEGQAQNNAFETRDFAVYMAAHAIVVSAGIFVLGYLCFFSQVVHGLFLVLVTVVTAHRGSRRYTYYVTIMYGRMLKRHFADVLEEDVARG